MKTTLFFIALAALCFGGWPLIARTAGKTGAMGAFVIAASALIPITCVLAYQGGPLSLSTVSMSRLMIAGSLMGVGFMSYMILIGNARVEMSVIVPVVSSLVIVVSTAGGIRYFGEPLTLQKIVGIVFLIIGIVCLRPLPKTQVIPAGKIPQPVITTLKS